MTKESNGEAIVLLYTLVATMEQAEKITKILIEKRFAACVNIIPGVFSRYIWKNQIEETGEFLILIKTLQSVAEAAVTEISAFHPIRCSSDNTSILWD